MEDDWIPFQQKFDELLLIEWNKHFNTYKGKSYLCLWYAAIMKFRNHAAISVGLISQSAMRELNNRCPIEFQMDQYNFSLGLEAIGVKIKDYSYSGNNWRILFWQTKDGVIYDFFHSIEGKKCLLAPLQYDLKDQYDFKVVPKSY